MKLQNAVFSLCIGSFLLMGCDMGSLHLRKVVADCSTNSLDFTMTIQNHLPYQFVLGVPQSQTEHLSFRGEMVLQQGTGVVARIPISSQDVKPCNWLPTDVSGYILTWSRTNHGERVSDILVLNQTYDVHVSFDQRPPAGSSLWFTAGP